MKLWRAIACLVALLPGLATAEVTTTPAAPAANTCNLPDSSFLHVESTWWSKYGLRLRRSEQEFGLGLLTLDLLGAVRGSPEAEAHARNARVWASLDLGFALLATALLTASLITYADDHGGSLGGWPTFIRPRGESRPAVALDLGWLLSLGAGALSRQLTYAEVMAGVNAYNLDVAQGRLR